MYLIPRPKTCKHREGHFYLSYKSRIVLSPQIRENGMVYASILKKCMENWAGFSPAVTAGAPEEGDIFLCLEDGLSPEEYELNVEENKITLSGGGGAGVLYAVETLCQMVEQCGGGLECIFVKDWPDLKHRGYYLDVTRGRVPKAAYLKKAVDRLCRYKINEFQLYIEHTYMFAGLSEMWRDETPLTAEEIMELDRYCRERHVELIPSLSSFGHLYTLLSTKTYGELCELEDSWKQPFSYVDRLLHHTVNVGDKRVLPLIKKMLEEYMALFSSDKFNICADETFDLGKGKSKALAEEKSVHRIYIDYVKELCAFIVEKGKQPMFWGDIICGEPELVSELPENVICLTWGYAPNQDDEASRKMAETGVAQYLCPGVSGWNQWLNLIGDSYQNIVRMCSYAKKYNAIGILNTDWGDFGHINHPEYSIPGMIYGAAFSWNQEIIPFEEINRQIARVEFHDRSEEFVNLLAKVAEQSVVKWWDAVMFYEMNGLYPQGRNLPAAMREVPDIREMIDIDKIRQANKTLDGLQRRIKETAAHMDSRNRGLLRCCDITIEGIQIWNEIGAAAAGEMEREEVLSDSEALKTGNEISKSDNETQKLGDKVSQSDDAVLKFKVETLKERNQLAERLESWFMFYKEMWREVSKEGDLAHLSEIVFWYADMLRERERMK
ncbi:MAG: family 20 glycosylhydrolase [Clostridium sp.]|nr:family 20 glycosylhydrolase [Clostridium sp.]